MSNPTLCDFPYPHGLLDRLSDPAALQYRPDPKGIRGAREAVARDYAALGVAVDPERIVLTASSSESYSFLFKLLCDPGDTVLVPTPSYPLFEHLAALDGVRVAPYLLDPTHGWQPVPPEQSVAGAARASILVHPNNPTGSWVDHEAAEALARRADRASIPLIVDEVFLDFPLDAHPHPGTFAERSTGLTFTLGGLSKGRGLPQLKLSWIIVSGPDSEVAPALEALAFIGDSYLSVGTPIQESLAVILDRATPVRDAILARCIENLACARDMTGGVSGFELLPASAGWSVILRFPRVVTEEALVRELLERHGVAVHPGYFFDFQTEGYLILSLLPLTAAFRAGLALILESITARL